MKLADFLASVGFYYHCVFLRKEEYDNVYWVTLALKGRAYSFEYYKDASKDCVDVFGGGKEQRPPRLFEVMEYLSKDTYPEEYRGLYSFLLDALGKEKFSQIFKHIVLFVGLKELE